MKPLSPGSRDDAGKTASFSLELNSNHSTCRCQELSRWNFQSLDKGCQLASATAQTHLESSSHKASIQSHKEDLDIPSDDPMLDPIIHLSLWRKTWSVSWKPHLHTSQIPTIWPVRSSTHSISSKFTLKAKPFPTSTRRCVEKWGEIFPGSMIIRSSWYISSSLVHVLQVFELHHGLVHLTKTARNTKSGAVLIDSTSRFSDHLFNCVESNTFFSETYNYLTTCLRNYGCAIMTVKNSAANVVRKPVWPCRFGGCYYQFELLLFLFKLLLIHILWILDGKTLYWSKKPKTLKTLVLMHTPWCLEW